MEVEFRDLHVGERGRVTGFKRGDIAHRQKLLSMGLTPGAEFMLVRIAPLGDPVEVRVRDTSLSVRKDEVSDLIIERVSAGGAVVQGDTRTIAIIGNPNCGKSTLFNGLTGAMQKVGNWPGVTVEKKAGLLRLADHRFQIVDLPGIYSLDAYDEAAAVDERIARDYILSGEADLIIDLVDSSHLERNLYLTTQLLEMRAPVVVVLNIMEEAKAREAQFDIEALQRRLGCPVMAAVATKRRAVEKLKVELLELAQEQPRPRFAIDYPPLIEHAISELSRLIKETSETTGFDRWLAIRLLEGDAFVSHKVDPAVIEAREQLAGRITQETGDEPDTVIASSRYRFIHALYGEALPKHVASGRSLSARIDGIALNRLLGIPIFLGVMYCLFWFTIQLSRAFKPFVNQLSDTFFVEGPRQLLGSLHAPAWVTALLADGLGNAILQVINFIPVIGFLYLFISVLEESGYMARANFVMDRLMQALGLPGNAFVPMMVGFGCNVPAIMATRTLERPRDRIVAVLMSPFMSCGGRLAVYTIFAAAFFPERGHLVIFGVYLLGVIFAMITALIMKNSLLPQERSLYALELPSYHWPKPRNVLINAWIRVKVFVFRVGKYIIPMVLVVKVLSTWGTDGSFNQQPIDHSVLAAGGRAITPILAPMGVQQDQWPATVALLTGVLHKVVIVSTLDSIYSEGGTPPTAERSFDLVERIKRAALTIPQNLKALIGLGHMQAPRVSASGSTLFQASETLDHLNAHGPRVTSELVPALASRFNGTVGALAYLILLLCYPCIATTAATARETNQRWMGFMVFWTVSFGYGMAVLFYQIGTFVSHPFSSTAWIMSIVAYYAVLGATVLTVSPLGVDASPSRLRRAKKEESSAKTRFYASVQNPKGVAWPVLAALLTIAFGAILIAYVPNFFGSQETETRSIEKPQPARMQQTAPAPPAATPAVPKEAGSTIEKQAETESGEREGETSGQGQDAYVEKNLPNGVGLTLPKVGMETGLLAFLENKTKPAAKIAWFDFDRVSFDKGKTALQPSSREQLQNIAKILSAFPNVKAIIGGRTDNLGNATANKRLSKARADFVLRELTQMGVDPSRLEVKGYGGNYPIATNDDEEGRAKNRRISLGVIRE